jgi:hypothetical protein
MGDESRAPGEALDLCCGGKKCPILREIAEGFELSDAGQSVVLTREQARAVADWLLQRLAAAE